MTASGKYLTLLNGKSMYATFSASKS